MCGICGIFTYSSKDTPIKRMVSCLNHRGPDDRGSGIGADRRRIRQLHPAQLRPAHRPAARRHRPPAHPVYRQRLAQRRQVGAAVGGRPPPGRANCQNHAPRGTFDGRRLPVRIRRGDDLPGQVIISAFPLFLHDQLSPQYSRIHRDFVYNKYRKSRKSDETVVRDNSCDILERLCAPRT